MHEDKIKELLVLYNTRVDTYISNKAHPIYHYTSPEGLNGIISNHTLRFTDRNYLNDYSEGRYVMELCKNSRVSSLLPTEHKQYFKDLCCQMLDNPLKKKVPTFQCSFSLNGDVLPLWNYYSKSEGIKGYNLGFDSSSLLYNIKTSSYNEDIEPKNSLAIFGGEVVYSLGKQKAIIKNIVSDFAKMAYSNIEDFAFCRMVIELLIDKLLFIGSFFKPNHFKYEEEYRILILPLLTIENGVNKYCVIDKTPESTVKNGLIIPHIDLEFNKASLLRIGISPTLDFEETKYNLKNALKMYSYNFESVNIVKSNIPVRF